MKSLEELIHSEDPLSDWWDTLTEEEMNEQLARFGKSLEADDWDYDHIKASFNAQFPTFFD